MRTRQRLEGLKKWAIDNLCQSDMKTPAEDRTVAHLEYKKPNCYLAWAPMRMDYSGYVPDETDANTAPFIKIMPHQSYTKNIEEKRFDRYNHINRPKDMGQKLSVDILFCVYEPGIRLPGFVESNGVKGENLDLSLLQEGTEQGLFTLLDWMDDCKEKLLGERMIPNTDLILDEETSTYSLYTDQSYVVDKRPLFYGFVTATFDCYATVKNNDEINKYL